MTQAALLPCAALSQVPAPNAASATIPKHETATKPEDVIVTATRRSEKLQRVPVTVSVVSAATLVKRNITTEADLQFVAPGLTIRTGASSNEVNYAIRGQSLDQYSGASPGVLPYFNDVQISSNSGGGAGSSAFYDLQSVQVLKGPQGTLFGRNATGGAVLFTTTKPTNDYGGYISGLIGDYDTTQFQGAVNLPIVADKLLVRVAGFDGNQEGYQHNLYDDSHPGSNNREGFRGSVVFRPVETLENDLVVDFYHIGGSSEQSVLYNLDNIPGAVPASFLYSPASGPLFQGYLATHKNPTIVAGGLPAFYALQSLRGPYTTAMNDDNVYRAENIIVTDTTTYNLDDQNQIKNIFGYGRLSSQIESDSDGSPFGIAGDGARNQPGQQGTQDGTVIFSDELQLTGKTLNQNLTYATGLYFADTKADVRQQTNFFDILGAPNGVYDSIEETTNYAVYAQGTYDLGSLTSVKGFSATAGLRFNSEKIQRATQPDDIAYGDEAANPGGLYNNHESKVFDNLGWTVGLQEQVNSDLLVYVTSRRSFKDGGFNAAQPPLDTYANAGGNAYRTERLTDVEVGEKFQGAVWDVPTRLNVAVFNDWITDSQRTALVSVDGSPSAISANVPKTDDFGFEVDGQILPLSWLALGGSLNYIDARFTDQIAYVFGVPSRFGTVPDTPKWSGTLFAEATIPVTERYTVSMGVNEFGQTKSYFSSSANINTGALIPEYTVTNVRVGLDVARTGFSLSVNVKNLFNKTYYVGGLPIAQLLDYNAALPGAPRTFTVEARYKF